MWVTFYFSLAVFTLLEIDENIVIIKNPETRAMTWLRVIAVLARILSLYIELALAYLQWSLFLYFIKRRSIKI
jgi:hypothetical protein